MPDQSAASLLPLPLSREEFIATMRDLQQAREPFFKAQADIHAWARPRWCVYADGKIEKIDDGLTPDARESIRQLTEMLAQVSKPYMDKLAAGYRDERP